MGILNQRGEEALRDVQAFLINFAAINEGFRGPETADYRRGYIFVTQDDVDYLDRTYSGRLGVDLPEPNRWYPIGRTDGTADGVYGPIMEIALRRFVSEYQREGLLYAQGNGDLWAFLIQRGPYEGASVPSFSWANTEKIYRDYDFLSKDRILSAIDRAFEIENAEDAQSLAEAIGLEYEAIRDLPLDQQKTIIIERLSVLVGRDYSTIREEPTYIQRNLLTMDAMNIQDPPRVDEFLGGFSYLMFRGNEDMGYVTKVSGGTSYLLAREGTFLGILRTTPAFMGGAPPSQYEAPLEGRDLRVAILGGNDLAGYATFERGQDGHANFVKAIAADDFAAIRVAVETGNLAALNAMLGQLDQESLKEIPDATDHTLLTYAIQSNNFAIYERVVQLYQDTGISFAEALAAWRYAPLRLATKPETSDKIFNGVISLYEENQGANPTDALLGEDHALFREALFARIADRSDPRLEGIVGLYARDKTPRLAEALEANDYLSLRIIIEGESHRGVGQGIDRFGTDLWVHLAREHMNPEELDAALAKLQQLDPDYHRAMSASAAASAPADSPDINTVASLSAFIVSKAHEYRSVPDSPSADNAREEILEEISRVLSQTSLDRDAVLMHNNNAALAALFQMDPARLAKILTEVFGEELKNTTKLQEPISQAIKTVIGDHNIQLTQQPRFILNRVLPENYQIEAPTPAAPRRGEPPRPEQGEARGTGLQEVQPLTPTFVQTYDWLELIDGEGGARTEGRFRGRGDTSDRDLLRQMIEDVRQHTGDPNAFTELYAALESDDAFLQTADGIRIVEFVAKRIKEEATDADGDGYTQAEKMAIAREALTMISEGLNSDRRSSSVVVDRAGRADDVKRVEEGAKDEAHENFEATIDGITGLNHHGHRRT